MDADTLRNELLAYLSRVGSARAPDIQRYLGISQPVFSRLVRSSSVALLVVGRARATRYMARRTIADLGAEIPLYAVGENGGTRHVSTLHAILPRGYWLEPHDAAFDARLYEDLPYFLHDQRPAGFLGRLIPRQHPQLDLPREITRWSGDTCMTYFSHFGWNLPGDLLVGDNALEKYIAGAQHEGLNESARAQRYPQIADDLLAYGPVGSSAGGEQPKFLATRGAERTEVIVKFSPPINTEIGRRWGDLLIAEHIAHNVLAEYGFRTPRTEIVKGKQQIFLEVERFDRCAAGGRRGVISLMALDLQFVGSNLTSWSTSVTALVQQGHCTAQALHTTRSLELFGQLIGNTDMHLGNLSFMSRGERLLDIAPIYDMLPMIFAPEHHQIVDRHFVPPTPKATHADIWRQIWLAALDFWQRVAAHPLISTAFAGLAMQCKNAVKDLENAAQRLPRL